MPLSSAATTFNRTRSVQDFRALVDAHPAEAARWVLDSRVVQSLRLRGRLETAFHQLSATPDAREKELHRLLTEGDEVIALAIETAREQAVGIPSLGWEAISTGPTLTGKLRTEAGVLSLDVDGRTYSVAPSDVSTLDAQDLTTFTKAIGSEEDIEVTIRGGVVDGKILADEWCPGNSPDFVTGRVAWEGDNVGIRIGQKFVHLPPEFGEWSKVGFCIPGRIAERSDGTFELRSMPDKLYMLTSLQGPPEGTAPARNETIAYDAITPSATNNIPTRIKGTYYGPEHDGYVRRFVEGKILPAEEDRSRVFEMTRAFSPCATVPAAQRPTVQGVPFVPVRNVDAYGL